MLRFHDIYNRGATEKEMAYQALCTWFVHRFPMFLMGRTRQKSFLSRIGEPSHAIKQRSNRKIPMPDAGHCQSGYQLWLWNAFSDLAH